ncbi:FAD-binding oxidoreductase [Nordella sp. HKS 07]|uniref:NAD(P)/FAD-dependent oxidoreductase n=1 Tax=Nordella sp. HKS 07 TaxID=2712222 RepID=UPI0013E128D2|nr:FAD-binding oxidoreductase [Nordella sp. HKS 07]QIG47947.1 FAD-binding oxidoreductase [Nordella sp. HKS 07]
MPVTPDHVYSDTDIPKKTTVAIIGGGIIGVATALELAERGVDVTLLEKGVIAGEQSSRNWGWCRQMGRDPREIPLILTALEAWRGMNARIGAETGFRQSGILYLCETDAELAARETWYERNAKPFGLDTRLISGEEAESLQPGATRRWKGALFTSADGRAEPFMAAPAMARGARAKGAKIFTHCAVRGLETSAGKVSAVVTEKGRIACDTVVLAGGAWSRRFLGNLDIPFPQLSVVNSVMRSAPIETPLERSCSAGKFAIRKRLDGGYTITHRHLSVADIVPDSVLLFREFLPALKVDWSGLRLRFGRRFFDEARLKRRWALDETSPFEEVRVLDPEPVTSILDEASESLKEFFPVFRDIEIVQRWGGVIDATPDAVPVMSPIAQLPGLYLATGFSGHGFGLGPGAGRLMADLVTGATPCVDPAPFRYTRYFDGTKPQPTTGF